MKKNFVISDMVLGCDDPTYNPSSVRILNSLTQFSSLTTLQSLVSGEGAVFSFRRRITRGKGGGGGGGLTKHGCVYEEGQPHMQPQFFKYQLFKLCQF